MIKIKVKSLRLGDVEDPDIYLGAAVWDWYKTDHGEWVKAHAKDLVYHNYVDYNTYGHSYYIVASFNDEDAMIYQLKFGDRC